MCCTRVTLPHLDSTRERVEPGNLTSHFITHHLTTSSYFISHLTTLHHISPHIVISLTTSYYTTHLHFSHDTHTHVTVTHHTTHTYTHTHTYMSSSFPQGEGRAASASRLMPSCGRIYNIWGNTRFGAIMNVYTLSDAFHLVATLRMY